MQIVKEKMMKTGREIPRVWLVRYADGTMWSNSEKATREEIEEAARKHHDAEIVVIL